MQRESLTRQGSKAGKIRVRTGREKMRPPPLSAKEKKAYTACIQVISEMCYLRAEHTTCQRVTHSPSHRRPRQSPDHSHLNSNHPHLQLLISTSISTTRSLILIVRSMVHYPEQYLTHLSLVPSTNLYYCLPEPLQRSSCVCVLFPCVSQLRDLRRKRL